MQTRRWGLGTTGVICLLEAREGCCTSNQPNFSSVTNICEANLLACIFSAALAPHAGNSAVNSAFRTASISCRRQTGTPPNRLSGFTISSTEHRGLLRSVSQSEEFTLIKQRRCLIKTTSGSNNFGSPCANPSLTRPMWCTLMISTPSGRTTLFGWQLLQLQPVKFGVRGSAAHTSYP